MKTVEYGQEHGPVLVLLHGGGLSWWNYREAAQLLAKRYHVVLPVLDGHADSGEEFTTIGDCADRLLRWIDGRFGGRVLAVGGVSLGAQVALELLRRRPDICSHALIESAAVKPDPLTGAMIAPAFSVSFGLIRRRWFARLQAAYLGIPEGLFGDYYRDTCAIRKNDMIAFLRASCGYAPELTGIRARVLIAAGGKETRRIRDSAKVLQAAIPGSRLELLPGLKHGELSLCRPEEYAKLLTDWIGRNEP